MSDEYAKASPLYDNRYSQLLGTVAAVSAATLYLDAATDKIALILRLPAGKITEVSMFAHTGGTAADDMTLRIESISHTNTTLGEGSPSGSLVVANANGALTNVGGTAAEMVFPINGGTGITLTEPTICAIVVAASSAAAFSVRLSAMPDLETISYVALTPAAPYWDGTDWKQVATYQPAARFNYDGTYPYIPMIAPTVDAHNADIDNLSTPNCVGMELELPAGDLVGVRFPMYIITTGNTTPPELVVLDATDTEVARIEISGRYSCTATAGSTEVLFSAVTVTAGLHKFYLAAQHATARHGLGFLDFPSAAKAEQFIPAALDAKYISATDPVAEGGVGTWTTDATRVAPWVPLMALDTAGGGGTTVAVKQGMHAIGSGINA